MRLFAMLFAVTVITGTRAEDAPAKPISPAEAAKKVNQKVTVEMEVESAEGKSPCFLNSEVDFKDAKNLTLFISEDALAKFKAAKINDPKTYFIGKLVRVTGTVTMYKEKPEIKIEKPEQIVVVQKK